MVDKTRSPIVSVLGHVDHGKSSILDAIRQTNIISTEAGAITQSIGASRVPLQSIKERCGPLLERLNLDFTIPGLLFIDTPGHAAFTSLRKRGGALADIAILVVDIKEGFMPQTIEAVEILKETSTPFVIAANKIDRIAGYDKKKDSLLADIKSQSKNTQQKIDEKIYEIVGDLHDNFKMTSERFDRVDDYTKKVAIVPCSATENIGIAELQMVVTGMAQRYLGDKLKVDVSGPAKGSILEVKEQQGLGTTIDVILYDGTLDVNDTIVIGGLNNPIVTKVRALLEPTPMSEMRDKKSEFQKVNKVTAATGVKIAAPGLENVLSGMPILEADKENLEDIKEQVQHEVESVLGETEDEGLVVKADSIGSLEALLKMLKEEEIPVARASVGEINKKDIAAARGAYEDDPLFGAILGFNVKQVDAPDHIKVITNDVIYRIIQDYKEWKEEKETEMEKEKLKGLSRPCKLRFLRGYVFRQNNPAIIGVDVLQGKVKVGTPLMKPDGTHLGIIRTMQEEQDNIQEAEKGMQVAISLPGVQVGRQIEEGDVMISALPENEFRQLKELRDYLDDDEVEVMKELAKIMREDNPIWGI